MLVCLGNDYPANLDGASWSEFGTRPQLALIFGARSKRVLGPCACLRDTCLLGDGCRCEP